MACTGEKTAGGSLSFNGTVIANFIGFSGWGSGSVKEISVSCADSTANEFIPGRSDAGSASFDINWIPGNASHVALEAAWVAGTVGPLVYTSDSGGTITQSGYISSLPITAGDDDVLKASVTVRLSGARVIA